jgi:hypothetical protein
VTDKKSLEQGELGLNLSPMPELLREDAWIAFGRVPTDYFAGKDRADYADITEAQVRAVRYDRLKPYLLGTKPGNVDGVMLSAAEYQRVVRGPDSYEYAVEQDTFQALALDTNQERRAQKAHTTGVKALADRVDPMGRTLSGIQDENQKVHKLYKASLTPKFDHIKAREMVELVTYVDQIVFGRILEVYGMNRQKHLDAAGKADAWTNETARQMRRALDVRLYLGVGYGDLGLPSRLKSWQDMLILAEQYGQARERLFKGRINQVNQKVGAYTVAHTNE